MSNKKPTVLVIMDGFGERESDYGNAVKNASLQCLSSFSKIFPITYLDASGEHVGLPEGQIGNSEVGHLNIGAGRVVYTGLSLINKDIEDKVFDTNEVLLKAIQYSIEKKSKFHIMGLFSNGGVHSCSDHIYKIIEIANSHNIEPILHIFSDGRDVSPQSIKNDLFKFEKFNANNNCQIGMIAGRFYAMDRDKRFDRTELTYNTLIGNTKNFYKDINEYINDQYSKGIYDEFIVPAIPNNKDLFISDNDVVIFANFRPDRARQIAHYFVGSKLYDVKPKKELKNLMFVSMMDYEGINIKNVMYPKQTISNTLGKVISDAGLKQLRIAETEKYAHVTFFMDGGSDENYPNMDKILIPSPKVETYDLAPKMSCIEITDKLISVIENYDFVILNYANPDMIGHTGSYKKTIESLECMDSQLLRLYEKVSSLGGIMFITSDHGNAEEMIDKDGNPITRHTINQVPFIITNSSLKLQGKGNLSNVAPTILDYMDIDKPKEMISKSLIKW